LMIVCVDRGVDLFAFEKLIATLSDWLVICHPRVPAVYVCSAMRIRPVCARLTPSPGVSMPAVTTKFDKTKHDMRNGKKTGWPLSNLPSAVVRLVSANSKRYLGVS
jgi:hypothetical protein